MKKILAIETSCDDTSVAVLHGDKVLSNLISSQSVHSEWGGIIPEFASREHINVISQLTDEALKKSSVLLEEIDAIAVTKSPGLAGSLLVGAQFAKGLALASGKMLIPVDHIKGHIYSAAIENLELSYPFISLVVSGGHTSIFKVLSDMDYEVLGSTIDDAAGEAYDKTAKLLGLGYPGGPIIDRLAKDGAPDSYSFPRPLINDENFNFSFSGLKTSVRYFIRKQFPNGVPETQLSDICASVQAAINDVLVNKTMRAARAHGIRRIAVNGGVAANSDLKARFTSATKEHNIELFFPSLQFSIDNAAMIAYVAKLSLREEDDNKSFKDLSFRVGTQRIRAERN